MSVLLRYTILISLHTVLLKRYVDTLFRSIHITQRNYFTKQCCFIHYILKLLSYADHRILLQIHIIICHCAHSQFLIKYAIFFYRNLLFHFKRQTIMIQMMQQTFHFVMKRLLQSVLRSHRYIMHSDSR